MAKNKEGRDETKTGWQINVSVPGKYSRSVVRCFLGKLVLCTEHLSLSVSFSCDARKREPSTGLQVGGRCW